MLNIKWRLHLSYHFFTLGQIWITIERKSKLMCILKVQGLGANVPHHRRLCVCVCVCLITDLVSCLCNLYSRRRYSRRDIWGVINFVKSRQYVSGMVSIHPEVGHAVSWQAHENLTRYLIWFQILHKVVKLVLNYKYQVQSIKKLRVKRLQFQIGAQSAEGQVTCLLGRADKL